MPFTDDPEHRFYHDVLVLLSEKKASFLVGGAFAFLPYTGISRDTKDLDLFCRPEDVDGIMEILSDAGYRTEITFKHWLGKAHGEGDRFVDLIYCSGNGLCPVDDSWFTHAPQGEVFGVPVRLMPPEEMIWQKAFIMERERFDGADVAHLLRACGPRLDWKRLLTRFGDEHWRVLLTHLVLFGFTYPSERAAIPEDVLFGLVMRLCEEHGPGEAAKICRGTFLSRAQYLPDIESWGYADPRLKPGGNMSESDVRRWTDPVDETNSHPHIAPVRNG